MALSINQKLSLLVAVLELLVASRWPQFSRPDWGFFNVPTLVFLGLTFIWLGNSFSGLRRINERTPGAFIVLGGWIWLLLPVIRGLVALLSSR